MLLYLLHGKYAAPDVHSKIMFRTVDKDAVVLPVSVVQELQTGDELWLAFGTGKGFQYLAEEKRKLGLVDRRLGHVRCLTL